MNPEENKVVNPLMGGSTEEVVENRTDENTNDEAQTDSNVETSTDSVETVPDNVPTVSTQPDDVTDAPAEETNQDEAVRYQNKTHKMKKVLQEQPQVQFIIPLGQGERKGAHETVQINGYKLTIMKGTMVTLPQQVVDILAAKYEINMTAGAEFRVDGDERKQEALS